MKKKSLFLSFLFFICLLSCSKHWTETIKLGTIKNQEFLSEINITIKSGLIIVPVIIEGEEYQFLFDTGAPFSISKEIQEKLNYKVVSEGNIKDSDNNRAKVDYVSVSTIMLNKVVFKNQTAFVTNFKSNPIIKCLKVDGIIGSNFMRHCNWKIDYLQKKITISNTPFQFKDETLFSLPIKENKQYSLLITTTIDSSKITNLKLDYGSNGSITIPSNIFNTLKQKGGINKTFRENGSATFGIVGKTKKLNRLLSYSNAVKIGDCLLRETEIKTGNSGLIGTEILQNFVVALNWSQRTIDFKKSETEPNDFKTFGFTLGISESENIYVQSITDGSSAFKSDLKLNMKVLKLDYLDFTDNSNYCDYIQFTNLNQKSEVILVVKDSLGKLIEYNLIKTILQ